MLLTAINQVAVDIDGTLYIDRQELRDALTANGPTSTGSSACSRVTRLVTVVLSRSLLCSTAAIPISPTQT